jgi:pyruvate carboxylase
LEINPRLQVEHTVTECISGVDLVQTQLLLAQGYTLQQLRELGVMKGATQIPESFSIQLRLCAENPAANFALSIGKVTEFIVPSGNGIRVDTKISPVSPVLVGSDFDNLLAKIVVTAASWEAAVRKARRVLVDTQISGVKTNIDLLRGILDHKDFLVGRTDTQWLEGNLESLVRAGSAISEDIGGKAESAIASITTVSSASPSSSNLLFRKGDAWSITLEPLNQNQHSSQKTQQHQTQHLPHHLLLRRILRNEFPSSFSAEIEYTIPSSSTEPGSRTSSTAYKLHLVETNTSASALTSATHRRGDPLNPNHILLPLSGKLIEVLVSEGDEIAENEVLAFVKQMKMELEVRSPRAGRVKWALAVDDDDDEGGEDVAEGILLVELEDQRGGNKKDGATVGDAASNKDRGNLMGKL